MVTNASGQAVTGHGYWAYGKYRIGSELPTETNFTGQALDATGLMYFNARYYDPDLGTFISPDTLVPDPGNVYDYNRYAYAQLNPLKFTDPTGYCAVLENGSPDTVNDAGCWDAANEWFGTFGIGGYASVDQWRQVFVGSPEITEEILRAALFSYWGPRYKQMGFYHLLYNPPPKMHGAPPAPQMVTEFDKMFAEMLMACAKQANGACGVSTGLNGQALIVGGRFSLDGYIDKDGNRMYYVTPAFGAQISTKPLGVSGSNSLVVAPGATVDNFKGLGSTAGVSAAVVKGLAVDVVFTVTDTGPQPLGISVGSATGVYAEGHAMVSYSFVLYDPQK